MHYSSSTQPVSCSSVAFGQIGLVGLFFCVFLLSGCRQASTDQTTPTAPAGNQLDVHSYARPDEAVIQHLSLHLQVDFTQQILKGYARYRIQHQRADSIVFDAKGLVIERVTLGEEDTPTTFSLSTPDPVLGSALAVALRPRTQVVTIYYQTTPESAALGWLNPSQTHDKKLPYLYTQGQAILTSTWIPIQDSPGIRLTYDAHLRVPPEMLAVMSASNPQEKSANGEYTFQMDQPIPPYLLALAVGDIQFKSLGPRSGVYAEPGMLEASAYELADLENMISAAESLYGPYQWSRYDLIVLPPSFPFGGMENPRLTFATPTIIAGDRSLVSLVAHELAHSWSGNLVTNATWNDFWLNEGFTTYLENRIMEVLYGPDYARMLALLGYQDLLADVADLGADSPDTRLKLDLAGRDPDEAVTDIAYEKGANFLRLLEQRVGRTQFDQFLLTYFAEHQFQSLTTEALLAYLKAKLPDTGVDYDTWLYQPGLPADLVAPVSSRFASVDSIRQLWLTGALTSDKMPTAQWTTHEWLHFVRGLPPTLTEAQMLALDQGLGFSQSVNSEILAAWFELAIRNGYSQRILSRIEGFLLQVGRRKFVLPLFRAMAESGQSDDAKRIFTLAASGYHAVTRQSVETLLYKDR